jgi:G6PDH family F420-dependent oxidoreductase
MVAFGYTLMTEQAGPRELVDFAARAERAGFDFEVCSDHYFPWLDEQGHAPYAWSVLGAVAQVTDAVELMTYVTCPIIRYHPAVVAQKATTMQLLSDGRFTLGVGAGENLNEHVVGRGWPPVNIRHEMLDEALQLINRLWDGGYVSQHGHHYVVDSAKIWDLPHQRPGLGVAVSGPQSIELAQRHDADMIAVEPDPELVARFGPSRKIGQVPISWDADRDTAIRRAHEQFRWFAGGWKVNSELPGTAAFDAATQFVTPDDVAANISCGPDVDAHVAQLKPFVDAGYSHVALVQIGGGTQPEFLDWAQAELLPALRALPAAA